MFVSLHRHDEMSLLDGVGTPKQFVERAVDLGQDALSISNHGNLASVPHHIQACQKASVKHIVGMEAYFNPDPLLKEEKNKKSWHLLLTAKNEKGWKNLIKLATWGHTTGFYHKPRIGYEQLQELSEGLIGSSACIGGYLPQLILKGDDHGVAECIQQHLNIFGDDYRLELMPHDIPEQKIINIALANFSIEHGIPLIATNDSHYPYAEWRDTQDIVLMIATNQSESKRQKKKEAGEDIYEMASVETIHFMSESEMFEAFARYHPDLGKRTIEAAIDETYNIANCVEDFDLDRSNKLPRASKSVKESKSILVKWCDEGLKRIGKNNDEIYLTRYKYELSVLEQNDVIDYIVLVAKMTRWARSKSIRISSGRGSAAGSLICYLCQITTIDPIAHGLLFERFLNPGRKGLPDIDLDFQHDRREEVKQWLKKEYGDDHVCDIAAFGTYGPKGALKDVSRVLDIPFSEVNLVTAQIPDPPNVPSLTELRETNDVIAGFAKRQKEVWKHALRIEGGTKQLSKHAGGVVITDQPITDYMPLLKGKSGIVTSWSDRADAPIISEYGFLKIDILSIDGLTRQAHTIKLIEERTGEKIDLDELPVAIDPSQVDPQVMKIFQKGLTLGIWQFGGSKGIMQFLRHTKPDRFEDLVAVNALYRTGPLQGGEAFEYGDRKHGKIPVVYWHESLEPFLSTTYGLMAYQEQLMEIVKALGDFTPAEADDMRKACSKLYRVGEKEAKEYMSKYQQKFMKGCESRSIPSVDAESIWNKILAFANYSFNKSHSTSYSLMSYQDAYLKSHYPLEFSASLLTYDPDRLDEIIRESKLLGVEVETPDINRSNSEFTIDEKSLLYGLLAVKYIGGEAVREILNNRPYTSKYDFITRVSKRKCNSRVVDNLVLCGAFDEFGERDGWTTEQKREGEIESLGVALSGTGDSVKYAKIIEDRISTEDEFDKMAVDSKITVAGELISIKKIKTRHGQDMAFLNIAYKENEYRLTTFPKQFSKYESILKIGNIVFVAGKKDDRASIIVNQMTTAQELQEALEKG